MGTKKIKFIMERKRLSYLMFILIITIYSCGQNSNSKYFTGVKVVDNRDEIAIKTLKEFYTMYITECAKVPENWENINSLKEKYLTKELQKKLKDKDIDYDPVINAQDCDEDWIRTLKINTVEGKDVYTVCFVSSFDNQMTCIKLHLVNADGKYLIDDIISDINIHQNEQKSE
jgi:hypothetical protein